MLGRILVIAQREFVAAVCNKAFLVGLLLMPFMMSLGFWGPLMMDRFKTPKERVLAIIDRTEGSATAARATLEALKKVIQDKGEKDPLLLLKFEDAPAKSTEAEQLQVKFDLAERVRAGELAGFFDIGPVEEPNQTTKQDVVTSYGGGALDKDMMFVTGRLVAITQLQKSAAANPLLLLRTDKHYKPEELALMLRASSQSQTNLLVQRDLPRKTASGQIVDGGKVESIFRALVPVFAMLLLFMVVMVGAMPQLHGVLEEKMNRIGEVLLGSASSFEILAGKLLGMSLTGLLLSSVYLGGALALGYRMGLLGDLRPDLPAWFILFQTLALLMFGSLFIAVGSACSDMKQAQMMVTPVTLAASLPMMMMLPVIEDPTGNLARFISLFPPATPMLMLCRMAAAPRIPLWEPLLGTILVLLAVCAALWVASRIFQNGYLRQGQAPTFAMLWSWLRHND